MIRVSKSRLKVVRKPMPVHGANVAHRALPGQHAGGVRKGPPVRTGRDEEKCPGDSTSET
jgi:hypothetical protein